MEMMSVIRKMLLAAALSAVVVPGAIAAGEQGVAGEEHRVPPQEGGKWEAAGAEVKKATGTVVEASRETAGTAWDALRNESVEAWEKTKAGSRELADTVGEKSKEVWHMGKAKIHEATAPEPPTVPAPPAAATPIPPIEPVKPAATTPQQ